jgi:Tol biopolymer transport system component
VDDAPLFSHDGTRIAFIRQDAGHLQIAVVNDDGSHLVILPAGVEASDRVEWSPDDRTLLVSPGTDSVTSHPMFIVPSDGTGSAHVLDVGMAAQMATWRPPDGNEILFRGVNEAGTALYMVTEANLTPRRITKATTSSFAYDLSFGWSPDGKRIAYQRAIVDGVSMGLWLIDADGTNERRLATIPGLMPIWSPDGTKVAFYNEQPRRLAVVDADDPSSSRVIGDDFGAAWTLTWTPDGKHIVQGPENQSFLIVLDPDTGTRVRTAWEVPAAPSYQRLPFKP